jgi:hypothetical protein
MDVSVAAWLTQEMSAIFIKQIQQQYTATLHVYFHLILTWGRHFSCCGYFLRPSSCLIVAKLSESILSPFRAMYCMKGVHGEIPRCAMESCFGRSSTTVLIGQPYRSGCFITGFFRSPAICTAACDGCRVIHHLQLSSHGPGWTPGLVQAHPCALPPSFFGYQLPLTGPRGEPLRPSLINSVVDVIAGLTYDPEGTRGPLCGSFRSNSKSVFMAPRAPLRWLSAGEPRFFHHKMTRGERHPPEIALSGHSPNAIKYQSL